MTDAPVSFGVIPSEQWLQPEWVDEAKAARVRHSMQLQRIPYGGSWNYLLCQCRANENPT